MQAPLYQQLDLAFPCQLDRLCCRCPAVRNIQDLKATEINAGDLAVAAILATGPTKIGAMIPFLAASTAPDNDVSSQGCATAVGMGSRFWQRVRRRSYLSVPVS
jgi:hypothetical protein